MDFDDVIHPLTRDEFLENYWTKSFVRIAGSSGKFTHLMSWDDLNGVLEQHRLSAPRLKLFQNGQSIGPERYLTPSLFGVPRIDAGRLVSLLAQGASLVLDDVQELAPRVRGLTQSFQRALHTDTYCNLYAGWHGQNAFDLHWDPQESMIVQLSGRKYWKVYEPTRLHPLKDDIEVPQKPSAAPFWEGVLEDGDAIHVPRGWWHMATPVETASLHLTIGTTPPTGIDYLRWVLGSLRRNPEIRACLPNRASSRAQWKFLSALQDELASAVGQSSLQKFQQEWEANICPSPHIHLPNAPYDQSSPLTPAKRIRLAALYRLSFSEEDGVWGFKASGVNWTVPAELIPALEKLSNDADIPVQELGECLANQKDIEKLHKSLGVLARAGVILIKG